MSTRFPAPKIMDPELASAERRGAERVRAELRDVIEDRLRVIRYAGHQIEVVEVSALAEVLGAGSE